MNLFEISNSSLKISSFPKKNGTFQNFSFQKKMKTYFPLQTFLVQNRSFISKKVENGF